MDNDLFKKLLQKRNEGQGLSPEEETLLRQMYNTLLGEELAATQEGPIIWPSEEQGVNLRRRIDQTITNRRKRRFPIADAGRIAAVFLLGFTVLAFIYWLKSDNKGGNKQLVHQPDILPGENKARLILSDGSVISLKDVQNGTIAIEGGVRIEKDGEGNIRYTANEKPGATSPDINTIATPNGGQYRITLPDGSMVMLNAASSLSYPVHFAGGERRIKMTGEVYFEIKKQPMPNGNGNVPFFVETAGQEVQVLGTHFNINAYNDESAIKTTLVEGSVKVKSRDGRSVLLKPGEQSVLAKQLNVQQADMTQQLAWINGDFIFRGETLENVLRQVGRWYDVTVEYPPHIGKLRFNGMISRSQPLSAIVQMIQSTKKASVTIKERRFIVTD